MPDYELIHEIIEAIQDRGIELSPWEKDFIPSIIGQYKMRGWLSDHQIVQVERIYREKTPDGKRETRPNDPTNLTDAQRRTNRVRDEGRDDYGRSGRERSARDRGYDD